MTRWMSGSKCVNPLRVAAACLILLTPTAQAGQYIYIANAGEATLSEVDVNQNKEVARIRTWPGDPTGTSVQTFNHGSNAGAAPSRIVVDAAGYIYVLNRQWPIVNGRLPVLFKIRRTAPPGGTTSHDANSNNQIDLLNPNEVMPLTVNFSTTSAGPARVMDSAGIKESRIEWAVEVGNATAVPSDKGGLGRSLCIDLSGYLWVGMNQSRRYYKINPVNGQPVGAAIDTPGHNPYGCVVDDKGRLWSVSSGPTVAQIDTINHVLKLPLENHSNLGTNYSISALRGCGKSSRIYLSEYVLSNLHISFDPAQPSTTMTPAVLKWPNSTAYPNFRSLAIGIDRDGNIISGKYVPAPAAPANQDARLVKYTPTGTVLWDTSNPVATNTVQGDDLHGLVIDQNNNPWAVIREPYGPIGKIVKYNGQTGKWMATVPLGKEPYTYANILPPNCPCGRLDERGISCQGQNGGVGTYSWSFTFTNQSPFAQPATSVDLTSTDPDVLFPGTPPPSTSTSVSLTPPVAPNTQGTVTGTFTVANGKPGERACFDMRLSGGTAGWCCPQQQVCFTLPECRNCADAKGQFMCDQKGTPFLQLTVTNNGPTTAQGFQLFSTTPGVTVSPLMTNVALPPGVPVQVAITVTGASAGQAIDLTVNVHGPTNAQGVYSWCCTSSFRVTYPTKKDCDWIDQPPIDTTAVTEH